MMRLYAVTERIRPQGNRMKPQRNRREPQRTRMERQVYRWGGGGRGGAVAPEPKKLLHSLGELGAHGSYYTGWEKDCQERRQRLTGFIQAGRRGRWGG
jgi:hypothetical protein